MSHIDELMAELAPRGVEFKALGDVGKFIRGNGLQKSDLTDDGAPAIHYGQIHTHYGVWTETTKSFTDPDLAARLRRADTGNLIIATTSEDDAAVAKATAWLGQGKVVVSGDAYIYRHTLDPRYVAYFFHSEQFRGQKARFVTGTKVRRVSGDSLAKIRIPLPPLEVQREIVRILDQFTQLEAELEAELQAELEARRQQFVHYRDNILVSRGAGEARQVSIGEVGQLFGGLTGKSKADFTDGNARFISYINVFRNIEADLGRGDFVRIATNESQRKLQRGDILFTGSSESLDEVAMSSVVVSQPNEPTYLNSFCIGFRLTDPELLDPHFAKHLFRSTKLRNELVKTANGVTRFNVSKARLSKVVIALPPMSEQVRIAEVLDKLAALVSDLTIGLPSELNARRKQYEYYRDKLFTFEEASA